MACEPFKWRDKMRKTRILCLVPNASDATSWYRAAGPLCTLGRNTDKYDFIYAEAFTWVTMHMADALFMQRPYKEGHLHLLQLAKDMGKPVWIDYDDDLFTIPTDNPAYDSYMTRETQKIIIDLIANADQVSVTTPHLKNKFQAGSSPLNRNVRVIPNAYDFKMFPYRREELKPRTKVVLWRGSKTHQRDLQTMAAEMIQSSRMQEFKDWLWSFVGDKAWFITDYMPKNRVLVHSGFDTVAFNKEIYNMCPSIIQVPLNNTEFNKSKSNIAWLEGIHCGAVGLVPDWEEWRRPGAVTYKDPKDYGEKLRGMMRGDFDLKRLYDLSYAELHESYDLSKVNKLRLSLLDDLTSSI